MEWNVAISEKHQADCFVAILIAITKEKKGAGLVRQETTPESVYSHFVFPDEQREIRDPVFALK